MIPLHDCLGRLACMGNPDTGFIECVYKGHKISTTLEIGESFTVERQNVVEPLEYARFALDGEMQAWMN